MAEHTQGRLFVHDFTDPAVNSNPGVRGVTISCDHPATIEIAAMGNGLTGTLDEARANARRIVALWNAFPMIPTEDLEALNATRAAIARAEGNSNMPRNENPPLTPRPPERDEE